MKITPFPLDPKLICKIWCQEQQICLKALTVRDEKKSSLTPWWISVRIYYILSLRLETVADCRVESQSWSPLQTWCSEDTNPSSSGEWTDSTPETIFNTILPASYKTCGNIKYHVWKYNQQNNTTYHVTCGSALKLEQKYIRGRQSKKNIWTLYLYLVYLPFFLLYPGENI